MRNWMLAALSPLMACTTIDTTEHCIATRYGRVVDEKGDPGLASEIGKDWTCFSLTDQNFPDQDKTEKMDVQTSDPVTLGLEVAMVYAYDPETIYSLFLQKRQADAVESEVLNSLRSGTRDAVSGWSVAEVFSDQRAFLSDSIKVSVQRKLGNRALLKQVYVRGISAPPTIEAARIASAQQAQVLAQARQQSQIDSVKAATTLFAARADNEARKLQAKVYDDNPKLLDLEVARARAAICEGVTTCILGASVLDAWGLRGK